MEEKYYQIEFSKEGVTRKGFAKISECNQFMTLLFHDHKNKWSISKEVISPHLINGSKPVDKNVFHTIVNQNLANL